MSGNTAVHPDATSVALDLAEREAQRVADFRGGNVQLRRVLGGQQRDRRQGDDPDQQSGYQGLKKREPPRGSPRFHASRSQGSPKLARQWLLYVLTPLLSSLLLFMTIWPVLSSYIQPPVSAFGAVAAGGASGAPVLFTTTVLICLIGSTGMPLRMQGPYLKVAGSPRLQVLPLASEYMSR